MLSTSAIALNHSLIDALVPAERARKVWGDMSPSSEHRYRKAGIVPEPVAIGRRNYWRESVVEAVLAKLTSPEACAASRAKNMARTANALAARAKRRQQRAQPEGVAA
jgi:hypothetical protein